MKYVAIGFGCFVVAVLIVVAWRIWPIEKADSVAFGTFVILAMTLIALVIYAYDTNSIAHVTRERWKRDGVLSAMYSMEVVGQNAQPPARTMFRIHNPSPLILRARSACNFRVYGEVVTSDPLYDGGDVWLVFPQQVSSGWFEIESLLQKTGKTVAAMIAERTPSNSKEQLTMALALEFWDELGATRVLPTRRHYFDFAPDRWAWIPQLAESPRHQTV